MINKKEEADMLQDFYAMYLRSPKFCEYQQLGGKFKIEKYFDILAENYLPTPKNKEETYEVLDTRGRVLFTGISRDIGLEYDATPHYVVNCCNKGCLFKGEYRLRKKKFDIEYFKEHIKDDLNGKID